MLELLSVKTIAMFTGTGIAAWGGEQLLDRIGRQDLKIVLDLSLFMSCLGYTAYVMWDGLEHVLRLFS